MSGLFTLYAEQYMGWGSEAIGTWMTAHLLVNAPVIFLLNPVLGLVLRRRPTHVEVLRVSMLGPIIFCALLSLLPARSLGTFSYIGLPLYSCAFASIPHYRATFSSLCSSANQGEQLALVAALESVPQLLATPCLSLAFRALAHSSIGPRPVFLCGSVLSLIAFVLLLTMTSAHSTHATEDAATVSAGGSVDPLPAQPPSEEAAEQFRPHASANPHERPSHRSGSTSSYSPSPRRGDFC